MRKRDRIKDIVNAIGEIWENTYPDLRFMQLINNFMSYKGSDCFYMEDEDFIQELEKYLTDLRETSL